MEIDRRVSFTLTLDLDDMRLARDAFAARHKELRTSRGVADLTDEQIATAEGDGPAAHCRRAGEYAAAVERAIAEEVKL